MSGLCPEFHFSGNSKWWQMVEQLDEAIKKPAMVSDQHQRAIAAAIIHA
jgi:hypothetical protein